MSQCVVVEDEKKKTGQMGQVERSTREPGVWVIYYDDYMQKGR